MTVVPISSTFQTPALPDGDYSADCRREGTTFHFDGAVTVDRPIPVETWIVEGGVSVVTGHVRL